MTLRLPSARHGRSGLEHFGLGNFPAFESRRFEPDFNLLLDGVQSVLVSRAVVSGNETIGVL